MAIQKSDRHQLRSKLTAKRKEGQHLGGFTIGEMKGINNFTYELWTFRLVMTIRLGG